MIVRNVLSAWLLFALVPTVVFGQRVEVSPFVGYRFGNSFSAGPIMIGGNPYDEWNEFLPKNGLAYGVTAGYFLSSRIQLEFLWSQQDSAAVGRSAQGNEIEMVDMKVNHFHGNLVYHWGDSNSRFRPFVFGGLGATQYNPSGHYQGSVHLSSDWGGGIKLNAGRHLGLRVQGRWIPTYIGETANGVISGPYNRWIIYNAVFHHQVECTVGAIIRF
jgi:hypothetical protein